MQFKLQVSRPVTDLRPIADALLAQDPAAVVDADAAGIHLRVASTLGADELLRIVNAAGYHIAHGAIVGVPSECCGGCGG